MKTKPFSIEEAKRTGRAVTRSGLPVRLLAFDVKGCYPIVGLITVDNTEIASRWHDDGMLLHYDGSHRPEDLLLPVTEVTQWINIYTWKNGTTTAGTCLFDTAAAAQSSAERFVGQWVRLQIKEITLEL